MKQTKLFMGFFVYLGGRETNEHGEAGHSCGAYFVTPIAL
jgi:hypothetical protein